MGQNIHVVTDNYKDVYTIEFYQNEKDFRLKMRLSRSFAELMGRVDASLGSSELRQVEAISNVDLSPLWNMATYHDEEVDVPNNNIDNVLELVCLLIARLNSIDNLQTIIKPYDYDIDFKYYFSDFSKNKGGAVTDNNFGQDLRHLQNFLEYAKSKGTSKVWFNIE